jgi:rod shape-determining protein MreB
MNTIMSGKLGRFLGAMDLAIDLGSTNTLIFKKGVGIVIDEPSVIAFQHTGHGRRRVTAVGAQVRPLLKRHSEEITVVRPVQHGAIADFKAAQEMLLSFFGRIRRAWLPGSLRVIANVPVQATEPEKDAAKALIKAAGASEVYLIEEARALALGAGLDISDEKSTMVIDIGGHITEMAVIVEGRVTCSCSIRIGSEDLDRAVAEHLRNAHGLLIADDLAEMVKIHIGEAHPGTERRSIAVEGTNLLTGRPRTAEITSHEICTAMSGPLNAIAGTIRVFLGALAPGQYVDILDRGIMLAGGGALLRNFDDLIARETRMRVLKARDPLACLVLGSGDALDYLDQYRRMGDTR